MDYVEQDQMRKLKRPGEQHNESLVCLVRQDGNGAAVHSSFFMVRGPRTGATCSLSWWGLGNCGGGPDGRG